MSERQLLQGDRVLNKKWNTPGLVLTDEGEIRDISGAKLVRAHTERTGRRVTWAVSDVVLTDRAVYGTELREAMRRVAGSVMRNNSEQAGRYVAAGFSGLLAELGITPQQGGDA